MNTQALAPADIDIVEMPKLDDAIDWLIEFVNKQLKDASHPLMKGVEISVQFTYADFRFYYSYLPYWRDHYRDIAALFREQGWDVTEHDLHTPEYARDEAQPSLSFKVAL